MKRVTSWSDQIWVVAFWVSAIVFGASAGAFAYEQVFWTVFAYLTSWCAVMGLLIAAASWEVL